jgi:hypothetical protein
MRVSIFILALTIPTLACSQSATPSTGHDKHQETSDPHASGVDTRGDHAMGFHTINPLITLGSCPTVGQSK